MVRFAESSIHTKGANSLIANMLTGVSSVGHLGIQKFSAQAHPKSRMGLAQKGGISSVLLSDDLNYTVSKLARVICDCMSITVAYSTCGRVLDIYYSVTSHSV